MDHDVIDTLTGTTVAKKSELARYYARLPEIIRLQVHRIQTTLMRENRAGLQHTYESFELFSYSMFLRAVQSVKRTATALSRKQRLTMTQAKGLTTLRVERTRGEKKVRVGKDRERVESKRELIQQLREDEHLSWRKIAYHLKKYHRLEISYSYLCQCYKKEVQA